MASRASASDRHGACGWEPRPTSSNASQRALESAPGVQSVIAAGSFRRKRETVADIDVLVETDEPEAAIEKLHKAPWVERVGGHGGRTGGHRTTVQLMRGPQVDLMVMPPGHAGTYLVHFTGSAEHNVRLRALARDKGWSLSEHGFARLDDNGELATGASAEARTFATEAEVYEFLGLPTSRPPCGRIAARSRPRGTAGCRRWSIGRTSRVTVTPTPSGRTGT